MTERLFDGYSTLYSAARPQYPSELFQCLISQIPRCSKVWDCATGNGQAAMSLAKYFERVEATDISTNQIEAVRNTTPNVHFSVQPAEQTNFLPQSFDLIFVAQALHWFDFDCFWPEVRRVLKPKGLFATVFYSWSEVSPEIDSLVNQKLRPVIEPYWSERNYHCWTGYRDIPLPLVQKQTQQFDSRLSWSVEQYLNYLKSWSATQRAIADLGTEFWDEFQVALLKNGNVKLEVCFPLTLIYGELDGVS